MPGHPRIADHVAGRRSYLVNLSCLFALLPYLLLSLIYYGHLTRSSFPVTFEYPVSTLHNVEYQYFNSILVGNQG